MYILAAGRGRKGVGAQFNEGVMSSVADPDPDPNPDPNPDLVRSTSFSPNLF